MNQMLKFKMSYSKVFLFYFLFIFGCIKSPLYAEKNTQVGQNQRVLFLGLPGAIFTSTDFIKRKDKIVIVDKATASSPSSQKELLKYGTVITVDDYYNSGEVSLAALKCFQRTPYTHLIAMSESDILRAAALRDYLNIEGQSLKSAEAFRDKVVMKNLLENNGIKTADFKALKNEIDLIQFIEVYGYPVIIKPRKAYGSIETYVLKNQKDLEKLLKNKDVFDEFQNEKFLVEVFINGDMYYVDGLIYQGEIVFICPSEYTATCLEMNKTNNPMRKGYAASYILHKDNLVAKDLILLSQRVLKSLPTPKNSAFFLEVFRNKKGEFVVCEIASRIGGQPNPQVLWKAFSIDLKKEYIRIQVGLPPSFSWQKEPKEYLGAIVLGTEKGRFKGLDVFKESKWKWIREIKLFINEGDQYNTTSGLLSLAAYFILPAKTRSSFIKQTEDIAHAFYSQDCWDFLTEKN